MTDFKVHINEDEVEFSFTSTTKCLSRFISFLLAGLFTLMGTLGFKVELKRSLGDEVTTDDIFN